MPDTATPITMAERHEQLSISVSEREHAAHAAIETNRQAIVRLTHERTQAADRQEITRSHQLGAEIAEHHRKIDAAKLDLRRLGEERISITNGTHPELSAIRLRDAGAAWAGPQAELAAAREAFQALLTPALQAAAQRLVHATRAMGTGVEPSILAKAVAGERIHLADAL